MKKFTDVPTLLSEIAFRKSAAAKARFGGTGPSSGVSTRELFLNVCQAVAAEFAPLGFRYAKSGPHFRRKSGAFTYEVAFQSSHNNVAGEYVALWIFAVVASPQFKNWRTSHGDAGDHVAGGQIGNLTSPPSWLESNLAAHPFYTSVATVVESIRALAIPYFAHFENISGLTQRLRAEGELPGMTAPRAIEFLMCFAGPSEAQDALHHFFVKRPELLPEYHEYLRLYTDDGVPQTVKSGYARELAAATIRFRLRPAA